MSSVVVDDMNEQLGSLLEQAARELDAAHVRHDYVGDQDVNWASMLGGQP